jgi:ABC-type thiamin/hydroxymethylpyrimidine transport system permease subunit
VKLLHLTGGKEILIDNSFLFATIIYTHTSGIGIEVINLITNYDRSKRKGGS